MNSTKRLVAVSTLLMAFTMNAIDQASLHQYYTTIINNKYVQKSTQLALASTIGYFGSQAFNNYLETIPFFQPTALPFPSSQSISDLEAISQRIKDTRTISIRNNKFADYVLDVIVQKLGMGTLANMCLYKQWIDPFTHYIFTNIWNNGRSIKDVTQIMPQLLNFSLSRKQTYILCLGICSGIARSTISTIVEKMMGSADPIAKISMSLCTYIFARSLTNELLTRFIERNEYFKSEYYIIDEKKSTNDNIVWKSDWHTKYKENGDKIEVCENNIDQKKLNNDEKLRKSVADSCDFVIQCINKMHG